MDTSNVHDIPIFRTMPKIILNNNNDILPNTKLNKITIEDLYQLEPFQNNNKFFYIILLLLIIFILCLLYVKK